MKFNIVSLIGLDDDFTAPRLGLAILYYKATVLHPNMGEIETSQMPFNRQQAVIDGVDFVIFKDKKEKELFDKTGLDIAENKICFEKDIEDIYKKLLTKSYRIKIK